MFSREQRRNETPSDAIIHERTLRLTMKKKSYIESLGMKYVCMWEHEFRETYRNDPELRHYLQNLDITDRLNPRESFFGGRTNASQLYYRMKEDENIE